MEIKVKCVCGTRIVIIGFNPWASCWNCSRRVDRHGRRTYELYKNKDRLSKYYREQAEINKKSTQDN